MEWSRRSSHKGRYLLTTHPQDLLNSRSRRRFLGRYTLGSHTILEVLHLRSSVAWLLRNSQSLFYHARPTLYCLALCRGARCSPRTCSWCLGGSVWKCILLEVLLAFCDGKCDQGGRRLGTVLWPWVCCFCLRKSREFWPGRGGVRALECLFHVPFFFSQSRSPYDITPTILSRQISDSICANPGVLCRKPLIQESYRLCRIRWTFSVVLNSFQSILSPWQWSLGSLRVMDSCSASLIWFYRLGRQSNLYQNILSNLLSIFSLVAASLPCNFSS